MIIYQFIHNSSCCESAYYTVSVHKTKSGAQKAMKEHKKQCKKEFDDHRKYDDAEMKKHHAKYPFDWDKDWDVIESELLE